MIIKGKDYKETANGKKYRFVTCRTIKTMLPYSHRDVAFLDKSGVTWATIENNVLHISKGYAWDGCTPKRKIAGLWIGTPDTYQNVHASLVHDVLFQFSATTRFWFTFEQVNEIFYLLLQKDNFPAAWFYYKAVMTFGMPFWMKRLDMVSKPL